MTTYEGLCIGSPLDGKQVSCQATIYALAMRKRTTKPFWRHDTKEPIELAIEAYHYRFVRVPDYNGNGFWVPMDTKREDEQKYVFASLIGAYIINADQENSKP
jgi:hypothetical protein